MNNSPTPTTPETLDTTSGSSLQGDTSASLEQPFSGQRNIVDTPELPKRFPWRRIMGLSLLVVGLTVGGVMVLYANSASQKQAAKNAELANVNSRIKSQTLPLSDLSQELSSVSSQPVSTLTVNGQVAVSDSLLLAPTAQPQDAVAGQMYFDQTSKRLAYYDGTRFITLQNAGGSQTINVAGDTTVLGDSITNITNINGGGGNVATNGGTAGALAMFTNGTTLGDSFISQSGSTLNIASSGGHTINLGSTSGASATTIQAGSGNLTLATGAASGVTGSISIKTGNSSTTASGDITIDAGSGVVDGELVSTKSFEGGLDNMSAWFGVTVAQSTTQARTGTYSLEETGTTPFNGIIENINNPITAVTPGHQYYFSFFVRAATTPRTINVRLNWSGSSTTVNLTPTVDNTTGWTEITGTAQAPAGATHVYISISHTGAAGEIHYFDDFTITDLSSASAISAISLGSTNAKIVTIGNLNQIGATSIYGGSGITLNSGAGNLTATGGVMSLTGNAASTVSTSSGALTLTSAAAATWGVGTASSGAGGDLTLRAGNGGSDNNNNGGNLILQGGQPNGTGIAGGVFVKPQTDATNAFQIQNSAGTALLTADTSGSIITISGTTSTFGKLVLDNAHFSSTQTTAPTIGTPASCGTTPTAAVTAGSTDTAGSFTITTGTGGTSSTCDTTLTFDKSYGAAPKSILVVGKTDAASAARQIYVSAETATTFTVTFGVSAAGADNTAYNFSYWVVE